MDIIPVEDLDAAIEQYKALGYRLDMIFPADDPREALVSRSDESVRLSGQKPARSKGTGDDKECPYSVRASATEWITGRAGMGYRDLIPDRMGGKVIASHIRLTKGGEVLDYVHYHKIEFQMIYCLKGRIKVVYEDQGEPFWLEPGDCVLQPPEIRHRGLECEANSEVIEITMPAEHETFADHDITLPTAELNPGRDFGGQRFFHYKVANNGRDSSDEHQNPPNIKESCANFINELLVDGEISTKYEENCRHFAEVMLNRNAIS